MDRARVNLKLASRLLFLPIALVSLTGCQTVRTPESEIAKRQLPRELDKSAMPDYVIEPPVLLVVEVLEALPGRPIQGEHLVRPDGTIGLGFYGDVFVTGLTMKEAKAKIVLHLRKYLTDETLGLEEADLDTGKPIRVAPEETDRVFVDVGAYNSKVYYIAGDVGAPGRFPITGNETVLDAIQYAGQLTETAAVNNIRLVRPAPPGGCCEQVLPVNYSAIVYAGDTTTNYQLMPNDRLVVYRDPIVRTTIFISRLAAPFNSVLNTMLTYSFTARSVKSINVPINGGTSSSTTTPTRNLPPVVNTVPAG